MKHFWLLLFFCLPLVTQAENVTETKARQVASTFLKYSQQSRAGDIELDLVYTGSPSRTNSPVPYYVFNNRNGKGFVIVSGEDKTRPILGFSLTSLFESTNLGDGLKGWLTSMETKINTIRNYSSTRAISHENTGHENEWKNIPSYSVEPSIRYQTALWKNGEPFNEKLPFFESKNARGCFGNFTTSLAIILRHQKCPDKGNGIVPGYEYDTEGEHITIKERQLGEKYLWEKMPLDIDIKTPQESLDQITRLMMDIGSIFKSEYSPWFTRENWELVYNLVNVLPKYFQLSPELRVVEQNTYSAEQWISLMINSLKETGPILYNGYRCAVIDGYLKDGFFHFNFVDGRENNGYYLLEPVENMDDFHLGGGRYTRAVLGIKSIDEKPIIHEEVKSNGFTVYTKQVELSKEFKIFMHGVSCSIIPREEKVTYEFVPWLTDKNGVKKEMIAQPIQIINDCPDGTRSVYIDCKIKGTIMAGDRIRFYFKGKYTPEWKLFERTNNTEWEIIFKDELGNIASFKDRVSISINRKEKIVRVNTDNGIRTKVIWMGQDLTKKCIKEGNELIILKQLIGSDYAEIVFSEGDLIKKIHLRF